MTERLLSIAEVAKLLLLSEYSITRHCLAGKLASVVVNGERKIPESAIEALARGPK